MFIIFFYQVFFCFGLWLFPFIENRCLFCVFLLIFWWKLVSIVSKVIKSLASKRILVIERSSGQRSSSALMILNSSVIVESLRLQLCIRL